MAVSVNTAERVSFVRGRSPPARTSSAYYFRPVTTAAGADDLDEAERHVFERCAARCLAEDDRCWFFSTTAMYNECSIHTGLFAFTSSSV